MLGACVQHTHSTAENWKPLSTSGLKKERRGGGWDPHSKFHLRFPLKHRSSFSCLILNLFNSASPSHWNPPSPHSCFQTLAWSPLFILILGSVHYVMIAHFFSHTSRLPKTTSHSLLKETLLPFKKYLLQVCCASTREKREVMPPALVSWQSRLFTHLYLCLSVFFF